jgi:hypothetical protein
MDRASRPLTVTGAALLFAACGGASGTDDADLAASASASATATAVPSTTLPSTTLPSTTLPSANLPSAVGPPADPGGPVVVEQVEPSPRAVTLSGLELWRSGVPPAALPEPLIDLAELRSGGPPPDGIPPIDRPRFLRPGDVDGLADDEPVLALEIDGDARAYPVQIMTWHEIVNDTVAGIPVAVTYCPLCNSAVAYDRRLGDRVLDFGTSGLLWNSALVMYDRQTETLWSHFTGEGVFGELTGVELPSFALSTVAWRTWRDAHPDGLVLSRDTGFDRDYGRNPYPGYDAVDGVPFLFEGEVDGRYTAMTRIVGIEHRGAAVGIPLVDLQAARVATGTVGGTELVAWWTPGTASALDTATISAGSDVGATGVFVPVADGQRLSFGPVGDDAFVDDRTGSTWNVLGTAVDGPLAGSRLEPLGHVDTFWFAWSTFRPDTELITP